jgi:hypothetical protein
MRSIGTVKPLLRLVLVRGGLVWSNTEIHTNGISTANKNTHSLVWTSDVSTRNECRERSYTAGLGNYAQHFPKLSLSFPYAVVGYQHRPSDVLLDDGKY